MTEYIRVSTRDYVRREEVNGEANTPVAYRGDLHEQQSINYSRQLNFWPWGRSAGSMSMGSITIDNRGGLYDQMIFRDLRDQEITVRIPTVGTAAVGGSGGTSTSTGSGGAVAGADYLLLTAIVDTVEAQSDMDITVSLKDRLTLLDVPLQTKLYEGTADAGVIDRPLPICLGIARSIRPAVWQAEPDEGGPRFRVHDGPLSGIFEVRFAGEVQSPFDSPPPWAIDAGIGGAGIKAEEGFSGLLTMDASSSGDAFNLSDPTDDLGGVGTFSDFTPPMIGGDDDTIPGWLWDGANPSAEEPSHAATVNFQAPASAQLTGGRRQGGRSILTYADGSHVPVRILTAGKSYRWQIRMTTPVSFFVQIGGGVIASEGTFVLRASESVPTFDNITPSGTDILFRRATFSPDNQAGLYSGTYTVPEGTDRYVQLAIFNGGVVSVTEVEFVEIPPPPPDELEGISLKDFELEIARRAGLADTDINTDDLDDIDPLAVDIGFYADRPVTALAAMRAPLNSFTADVYTARSGQFRFARLRDPALEIPVLNVDRDRIVQESNVIVRPDTGEGLTTSIVAARQWYVYRDSDFSDDATVSLEVRESLKREGRFLRTAVLPGQSEITGTSGESQGNWPRLYRHAVNADPLISLYDDPSVAAAEIQRIIDIYSVVRHFVELDIWLDPGESVDLDQVVFFKYPRYDFDAGKNMLIVGVTDAVELHGRRRLASIRLWG